MQQKLLSFIKEPKKTITVQGAIFYHLNDKLHREDGPALCLPDGLQEWYQYGLLHREDGPAVINPILEKKEWWIKGNLYRVEWSVDGQIFQMHCLPTEIRINV